MCFVRNPAKVVICLVIQGVTLLCLKKVIHLKTVNPIFSIDVDRRSGSSLRGELAAECRVCPFKLHQSCICTISVLLSTFLFIPDLTLIPPHLWFWMAYLSWQRSVCRFECQLCSCRQTQKGLRVFSSAVVSGDQSVG